LKDVIYCNLNGVLEHCVDE